MNIAFFQDRLLYILSQCILNVPLEFYRSLVYDLEIFENNTMFHEVILA